MMPFLEELVRGFVSQGNFGVLALITVITLAITYLSFYLYGRSQIRLIEEYLNDQKIDRSCLLEILTNNTTAMVKNLTAIEKCSTAVTQNNQLIQIALTKITQ